MNNDYLELTFKSITCFSNNGELMIDKLNELLSIALRDGVVDQNEKRVLSNIFSRLKSEELTPEIHRMIENVKDQYF